MKNLQLVVHWNRISGPRGKWNKTRAKLMGDFYSRPSRKWRRDYQFMQYLFGHVHARAGHGPYNVMAKWKGAEDRLLNRYKKSL